MWLRFFIWRWIILQCLRFLIWGWMTSWIQTKPLCRLFEMIYPIGIGQQSGGPTDGFPTFIIICYWDERARTRNLHFFIITTMCWSTLHQRHRSKSNLNSLSLKFLHHLLLESKLFWFGYIQLVDNHPIFWRPYRFSVSRGLTCKLVAKNSLQQYWSKGAVDLPPPDIVAFYCQLPRNQHLSHNQLPTY